MILLFFFHQALNQCISYIITKEKKNHKIWPLKVYSNLKGKSYNRGVRAHKLTMEAMLGLQCLSFTKWILQKKKSSPESLSSVDENCIIRYCPTCMASVIDKS